MAAKTIPDGYQTVTPYLVVKGGAAALDFYKTAFGATELYRLEGPGGSVAHAEFQIGDCRLMVSDEWPEFGALGPESRGGSPVGFNIYVEDVDAAFEKAVAAGGKVDKPVQDQFYGDRSGTILDPAGHKWTLSTRKEDVSPAEMQRRMDEWMAGAATESG